MVLVSASAVDDLDAGRHRDPDLLDETSVLPYLVSRGLASTASGRAERLTGGVSNVVLRVALAERDVVVKQALGRLAVRDAWFADRGRSHTEAQALAYLATLSRGNSPELLDDDPSRHALTIEAAPRDWVTLKSVLMAGDVPVAVLGALGGILRTWHDRSAEDVASGTAPSAFADLRAFRQLRLDPYFGVAAHRLPADSALLQRVAAEVGRRRSTLVLGDFSPKNVLVDVPPERPWVIDLEVAHLGDPTFDVAFMCSHLLLKWVHLPAARVELQVGLEAFLRAYGAGPGTADTRHLGEVVACLLLARVAGSSPADYLTVPEREQVLAGARRLVLGADDPAAWTERLA